MRELESGLTIQYFKHEPGTEPETLLEKLSVCRVIKPVVALFGFVEQFYLFLRQRLSQRVVGCYKLPQRGFVLFALADGVLHIYVAVVYVFDDAHGSLSFREVIFCLHFGANTQIPQVARKVQRFYRKVGRKIIDGGFQRYYTIIHRDSAERNRLRNLSEITCEIKRNVVE